MAFKNVFVLICVAFAASASAEATEDLSKDAAGLTFKDKDGSVSFEEFAGLSGDHGLSPEEVAEMKKESKPRFDKLDEDKSGKLSQSELDKEEEEPEKSEELALGEEADEDDASDEDTEGADEFSEDEAAADDDAGDEDVEQGAEDEEAADEDDEDEMGLDDEQVSAMEAESGEVEAALVEGTDTVQKMANQMLEDLDKNKDNQLSFEELAGGDDDKQSESAETDNAEDEETKKEDEEVKQEMQTHFRASDKNNDGMLSMEELEAFHQSTGETVQEAEGSTIQGL